MALAALLGVLTWQQSQTYASLDTLWRTTLERNPDSFLAHIGLGTLLLRQGQVEEGQAHLQQAAAIKPEDAMVWMDLCGLALAQGRLNEALEWGRKSVALDPDMISAHYNLAKALLRANRAGEAVPHFLKVLAARPDLPEARLDLGSAYGELGRWPEAARQFQQAAELRPGLAAARIGLAEALVRQGNPLAGLGEYQRALDLQPTNCAVLNNLAWVLATCDDSRARDGARAVTLAQQACRLTGFAEPQLVGTLAAAYAEAGRFPEAVAAAEQAKTLATAAHRPDLAQRNEELLQSYRQGKAYHAPARNRP
jgi:Flp pilus assembly protein TadD